MCRTLRAIGARTIATVGQSSKAAIARDAGAEVVLVEQDLGDEGVEEAVLKHTSGKGVRAVFDGVGDATFERSLRIVAQRGTLVSFGLVGLCPRSERC